MSFGSRNSGMPYMSTPPGLWSASKMVTSCPIWTRSPAPVRPAGPAPPAAPGRPAQFSQPDELDELGDLDVDGAPFDARRVLALDAAGGLEDRQVGGQPVGDFPEILPAHFRGLLRHRLFGNTERLGAGGRFRVGHYRPPPLGAGAAAGGFAARRFSPRG